MAATGKETGVDTFADFLTSGSVDIDLGNFVINLLLAAILSYALGKLYVRYGNNLSNRAQFAKNFVILAMVTMVIIAIVKSSLALSLGLVGALSIVRFRSAIKEPEELLYLFLSIAIGLGFGADQRVITLIAFVVIALFVLGMSKMGQNVENNQNLHLTVFSKHPEKMKLEDVVSELEKACEVVNLKRFDEASDFVESSFLIEFASFEKLSSVKQALQAMDKDVKISFLDNKGIVG